MSNYPDDVRESMRDAPWNQPEAVCQLCGCSLTDEWVLRDPHGDSAYDEAYCGDCAIAIARSDDLFAAKMMNEDFYRAMDIISQFDEEWIKECVDTALYEEFIYPGDVEEYYANQA